MSVHKPSDFADPLRDFAGAYAHLSCPDRYDTIRLGAFALLHEYSNLDVAIQQTYQICETVVPVDELFMLNRLKEGHLPRHPSLLPDIDDKEISNLHTKVNTLIQSIDGASYVSDYITAELEPDVIVEILDNKDTDTIYLASQLLIRARCIGRISMEFTQAYEYYCD